MIGSETFAVRGRRDHQVLCATPAPIAVVLVHLQLDQDFARFFVAQHFDVLSFAHLFLACLYLAHLLSVACLALLLIVLIGFPVAPVYFAETAVIDPVLDSVVHLDLAVALDLVADFDLGPAVDSVAVV